MNKLFAIHSKQIIIALLLLIAAIASGALFYQAVFKTSKHYAVNKNKPDAIVENVRSINFNKMGTIKSDLTAPKLTHYPANDHAVMLKPHLVVYNGKQQPWTITADHGESLNNGELIHLIDNVKLHQPMGKNNQDITITTSLLTIFPKKHMAETKKLVTLVEKTKNNSNITVKAIGARVYQKTGVVQLLSHTRGEYAPNT